MGSAFGANLSFILKARVQLLRDLGAAVAPFNAWLIAQGLETLSLRVERHVQNAQAVATWLEGRDEVLSTSTRSGTSTSRSPLTRASGSLILRPARYRCSTTLRRAHLSL